MSTATTAARLVPDLRAICGAEHVAEPPERMRPRFDNPAMEVFARSLDKPQPIAVTPASVNEIAAILRLANQHGFSVFPAGTAEGRPLPFGGDVVLYTTRLRDVEHYDPADLTVGVGAGMSVAQLSAMVGADHLLFASDPPFPERATIGSVLATASHGPMRHGYGALRDFCLGVRFITGDGRKAKGGGRVVKNVAGYDMMKLLIGSHGTLAVITSASFKLFPAPRQTRTFVAQFTNWMEALKFRDAVLCSPLSPMCLELVSPSASQLMRLEIMTNAWGICIRASGSDAVLARYRKELGLAISSELDGDQEDKLWHAIQKFPSSPGVDESSADITGWSWSQALFSVPVSEVSVAIGILQKSAGATGVAMVGRVGIGNLVAALCLPAMPADPSKEPFDELRRRLSPACCARIILRGKLLCLSPTHEGSMRAVKQALDPNDILNRGRFRGYLAWLQLLKNHPQTSR